MIENLNSGNEIMPCIIVFADLDDEGREKVSVLPFFLDEAEVRRVLSEGDSKLSVEGARPHPIKTWGQKAKDDRQMTMGKGRGNSSVDDRQRSMEQWSQLAGSNECEADYVESWMAKPMGDLLEYLLLQQRNQDSHLAHLCVVISDMDLRIAALENSSEDDRQRMMEQRSQLAGRNECDNEADEADYVEGWFDKPLIGNWHILALISWTWIVVWQHLKGRAFDR